MPPPLQLSVIQNWSCHNCGGCCRQHEIDITDEERRRIEAQGWRAGADIPVSPIVTSGPPWKRRYRLAHQEDGACVFLDEKGLCKIHSKFGEPTKPLACRLYPFVFHPAGESVAVSLRFSCPSVVANNGRDMESRTKELRGLEAEVVPENAAQIPPPYATAKVRLTWTETHHVIELLDTIIEAEDVTFPLRLWRSLFVLDLLARTQFEKIRGERLVELLQLLADGAVDETPEDLQKIPEPSRTGRMHFRLLASQYARRDTAATLQRGWIYRYEMFKAALKFTHGRGNIPRMQDLFAEEIPFAALETPFGLPEEATEIFQRYYQVKLQGMHFCGPAYYNVPLIEGFQSLALVYPVTLWLARWLAAGAQRSQISTEDISIALAMVDHHHGYSPAFGLGSFRARVRMLAQLGDISKLVAWYSR